MQERKEGRSRLTVGSIASSHGEAASAAGPMDINTEVPPAPKEASSAPAPSSSTGEPASQPGPSGSLGAAFLADSSGSRKRTLEQEKEYLTKRLKQLEDEEKGVVEQKLAEVVDQLEQMQVESLLLQTVTVRSGVQVQGLGSDSARSQHRS